MTTNQTKELFTKVCDILISIEQYEMCNCVDINIDGLIPFKDVIPKYIFKCYDEYINAEQDFADPYFYSLKDALTAYARVLNNLI